MNLTNVLVTIGLQASLTPTRIRNTIKPIVGYLTRTTPVGAVVIHAYKATADSSGDTASLFLSSGNVTGTTGVLIEGATKDAEGIALPAMTKYYAVRIRASGTGTVTLSGSNNSRLPAMVLDSGADILLKLPAEGLTLAAYTLIATFSAAGGVVEVEALAG